MIVNGLGWPNFRNRWCTALLKTRNMDAYLKNMAEKYDVVQYLGIAADETQRLEREIHKSGRYRYPLVEWGWTEKDCLDYCYSHGYDWGGLYHIFNRVSCWMCPLQPLSELYKLWETYPELWQKLRTWDEALRETYGTGRMAFRKTYHVADLEERFKAEYMRKQSQKTLLDF